MNTAALPVGLWLTVSVACAQPGGGACRAGRTEPGGTIGRNQYFGDMHCSKPYASSGLNLNMQVLLRQLIDPYMRLRASLTVGGLADSDLDNPDHRWNYRQARFTSLLIELAALVDLYPLLQWRSGGSDGVPRRLTPYAFIGPGGVYTNPTVTL